MRFCELAGEVLTLFIAGVNVFYLCLEAESAFVAYLVNTPVTCCLDDVIAKERA